MTLIAPDGTQLELAKTGAEQRFWFADSIADGRRVYLQSTAAPQAPLCWGGPAAPAGSRSDKMPLHAVSIDWATRNLAVELLPLKADGAEGTPVFLLATRNGILCLWHPPVKDGRATRYVQAPLSGWSVHSCADGAAMGSFSCGVHPGDAFALGVAVISNRWADVCCSHKTGFLRLRRPDFKVWAIPACPLHS